MLQLFLTNRSHTVLLRTLSRGPQRTDEPIAATEKDKMSFVPVYGKTEGRGKVDKAQGQILMSQTC